MLGPLAVAPERRGSGFAATMLEEAISQLRAAGVLRFELMVEADNPRGVAFYSARRRVLQEARLPARGDVAGGVQARVG